MILSSTCVLLNSMPSLQWCLPCIFVIFVVTSTSLQSSVIGKSEACYHLHFCHACLNLLMSELAVAQCSYFVKHHECIPAMYFVAMFECCSIFILMLLDGYLLLITDRCHICFACHFQTVHPIPVIFISISTEINSCF